MNLPINSWTMFLFRLFNMAQQAKKKLTKARVITAEDVRLGLVTPQSQRPAVPGHIITLETKDGEPEEIQAGDFVAEGPAGEIWRIKMSVIARRRLVSTDQVDSRWNYYADDSIRTVYQLAFNAKVTNPNGDVFYAKKGDWLVYAGNDWWIVEQKLFSETHDLI